MQRSRLALFPGLVDFLSQGLEVAFLPRALADQRRQHQTQRAAEKGVDVLLQRIALFDARRSGCRIDVAEAVLLMTKVALGFEPPQHDSNRRISWRIGEPRPDLRRGRAVSEREDRVHDFPFAARKSM